MIDILSAVKQVYAMDMGTQYDATLLAIVRAYNLGGKKGRASAIALLQSERYCADPCAAILREILGIKKEVTGKVFNQCQWKRATAPDWVGPHGWRIKKWPSFMPYIQPTPVKE